ncbi:Alpha/Beta hydrolase protein [Chaetomium sp. MPI-SDFR-AT-0129]|nr:Alpha/Beta hydrolase protein [Chaetomium sp. MPI-SDFR-AT-0129]
MVNILQNFQTANHFNFPYLYEENVHICLKAGGVVRCNIYRPKTSDQVPVLVTYGPYGKDIYYGHYRVKPPKANPRYKSVHPAWETPDPGFWTEHGYAVIRADEAGTGQSPGVLDPMSRATTDAFVDVVEWAAEQPWSSGKVGLLGTSYYAESHHCRHGGILSNTYIETWWNSQIVANQYGRPGRAKCTRGPETLDGDLSEEQLVANRRDQTVDNRSNYFLDDEYYASRVYNFGDIEVPLLSVGNWGDITLHLRGNIEGFTHAGSKFKYLRIIVGRHDRPFYYQEEVEVQRSFLDAFLKGEDRVGWATPRKVPPVSIVVRKGDVGVDNPRGERTYRRREEDEWPIGRTHYSKHWLTPSRIIHTYWTPAVIEVTTLGYRSLGTLDNPRGVRFATSPFQGETEITGHITVHLNISRSAEYSLDEGAVPCDIDIFLTLRHISPEGKEILYTGPTGDPVPVSKGWLRVSLRKVNTEHPYHRDWLPRREYRRCDVQAVVPGKVYGVDVEMWPTNVVVEARGKLILDVTSGDTQGCGDVQHDDALDRPVKTFAGMNYIHFAPGLENYIILPEIPSKAETARGWPGGGLMINGWEGEYTPGSNSD